MTPEPDNSEVPYPKSHNFEDVNDFVHHVDVGFEDLLGLCLGLATELEKRTRRIDIDPDRLSMANTAMHFLKEGLRVQPCDAAALLEYIEVLARCAPAAPPHVTEAAKWYAENRSKIDPHFHSPMEAEYIGQLADYALSILPKG